MSSPSHEQMLHAVMSLGADIHLEMDEQQILEHFLRTLRDLFPGRAVAIRALDVRTSEPATVVAKGAPLRADVAADRLTLKRSAVDKTKLKDAVVSSARVRVSDRWFSPFQGVPAGFCIPLVASGELYGVLDIGYSLGSDSSAEDELLVLPIANHLSVSLRNERLVRDTTALRDYNATLIEQANALILGVDRRWRITVCNRALSELTGYVPAEVIGSDMRDWLPIDDRPRLFRSIMDALTGRISDAVEVELVTRGGGSVWTVWSVAAIRRRGKVEAVVAVGQDLTRLRDLQSQVIQSEKLATLGQLAAGVVHELNNPLTSITVYADYLLKKAAGDAAGFEPGDTEKLHRICASAQRILSFSRDLVQYAKPSTSRFQDSSADDLVDQALSFCEHLFSQEAVSLDRHPRGDLPAVRAIPGQLEQVVINLVTNAVHAAGAGGRVAVRTGVAAEHLVEVVVEDSGPGIAQADRERIFEPFFTTKTDGGGTGLGLSIVRNIVDQHDGEISVGDAELGGAAVRILLPSSH